ncbi:MBL fold metallo-hydrolase [Salinirubrum litoreum]|uniref:MBL fold metallo-hydrolase n=1 Tax=Salinirubrum litoreum TaxID=1126234 RepID=A0ABD5R8P1_9EURY|nr:MBL fold metallo-hydrolase [Salinirubrum litoreum]
MLTSVTVPVETRAPGGTTNAYLVGQTDTLLVDPPARSPALDGAVGDHDVQHLAVTHTHPDHVGAVADYARETDATVWCRRGRERRFREATGVGPDRTFAEGTTIPSDPPVTVLDTPGHAPDHVAFAFQQSDTNASATRSGPTATEILVGDLAVAEGSVVVGAPEGDVRAYCTALRRLLARDARRLHPGHGPTISDPRATCTRLLAHRHDREHRIESVIRGGARDIDAVLDAAYEKDLTGVRDLARATVIAHVEKLARAGRIEWDADSERVAPA